MKASRKKKKKTLPQGKTIDVRLKGVSTVLMKPVMKYFWIFKTLQTTWFFSAFKPSLIPWWPGMDAQEKWAAVHCTFTLIFKIQKWQKNITISTLSCFFKMYFLYIWFGMFPVSLSVGHISVGAVSIRSCWGGGRHTRESQRVSAECTCKC